MRLINTTTLKFKEFMDAQIPKYAILSHRWGDEEVSWQEYLDDTSEIRRREGHLKIVKSCELASQRGHQWVWVDTCCIDKKNSMELSEAINSMFKWYSDATECYAYLNDVTDRLDLKSSLWFTRGWTLQELLAPCRVEFFDKGWYFIGNRESLHSIISEVTGIDDRFLVGYSERSSIALASVAEKMSWASKRSTSRYEDMAYCLMGLFDINMPQLYGEGAEKAFRRLQEEIIRRSGDESIFAWGLGRSDHAGGALAKSPSLFKNCSKIMATKVFGIIDRVPNIVTHKGLQMEVKLFRAPDGTGRYYLPLNCCLCQPGFTVKSFAVIISQDPSDLTRWYRSELTTMELTCLNDLSRDPGRTPTRTIYLMI